MTPLTPMTLLLLAFAPTGQGEAGPGWIAARTQLSACLSEPSASRGACLERAARALDAAEARGEGPLPSPEQARERSRRSYGKRQSPTPDDAPGGKPGDSPSRLSTTLASAAQNREGAWVMRTAEGAVWAQTDQAYLVSPPHAGSSFAVRPGALGSFFCLVGNRAEVRCKRRN